MRIFAVDIKQMDDAMLDRLYKSLPPFRRASADRCKNGNYPQHVVSFCLVRYAARQLDPKADTEAWHISEGGKPSLACGGPFFNLSHADTLVAVAASSEGEVGIDVEEIRPHPAGFAEKYFSKEEQEAVAAASDPISELIRIWTAKEAEGKRLGTGLSNGIRGVCTDGVQSKLLQLNGALYWLSASPAKKLPEVEWISLDKL